MQFKIYELYFILFYIYGIEIVYKYFKALFTIVLLECTHLYSQI